MNSIHTRYAKCTHKFETQVPATAEEALDINKEMNTIYWHDVIKKQMKNAMVAFHFLQANTGWV